MPSKICTKCIPNHYEDCGSCFGFGLYRKANGYSTILIPLSAMTALDFMINKDIVLKYYVLSSCTECKSTIEGLPQ